MNIHERTTSSCKAEERKEWNLLLLLNQRRHYGSQKYISIFECLLCREKEKNNYDSTL